MEYLPASVLWMHDTNTFLTDTAEVYVSDLKHMLSESTPYLSLIGLSYCTKTLPGKGFIPTLWDLTYSGQQQQ